MLLHCCTVLPHRLHISLFCCQAHVSFPGDNSFLNTDLTRGPESTTARSVLHEASVIRRCTYTWQGYEERCKRVPNITPVSELS